MNIVRNFNCMIFSWKLCQNRMKFAHKIHACYFSSLFHAENSHDLHGNFIEFYASHVCLFMLIPYRNVRDDAHFYLSYLTYLYIKDINVFHLPCTRQISPQLLIYNANKNTMLELIRVSLQNTNKCNKLCKGPQ